MGVAVHQGESVSGQSTHGIEGDKRLGEGEAVSSQVLQLQHSMHRQACHATHRISCLSTTDLGELNEDVMICASQTFRTQYAKRKTVNAMSVVNRLKGRRRPITSSMRGRRWERIQ